MIKLLFLMIFLFMGTCSLAAQASLEGDQEFRKELDNVKNPFEDATFKSVITIKKPPVRYEKLKPKVFFKPISRPVISAVILPPKLNVQGVIVGEGIHQAIINGQVVPLRGTIEGAQVISVTKQGVELFFKGKKFFLKVD